MNFWERRRSTFGLISLGDLPQKNLDNNQTTQRFPAAKELLSVLLAGRDFVQSNQQNSGVPKMKEADRIGFEKFPNSNTFVIWQMNLQREVCSSSSFSREAVVWINETDSARNMDELKLSNSILGRMILVLEVPDSKKKRQLSRSC